MRTNSTVSIPMQLSQSWPATESDLANKIYVAENNFCYVKLLFKYVESNIKDYFSYCEAE